MFSLIFPIILFFSGENAWGAELENGREGERFKASWMVEPEKEEETKEVVKEEGTIDGGGGGAYNFPFLRFYLFFYLSDLMLFILR